MLKPRKFQFLIERCLGVNQENFDPIPDALMDGYRLMGWGEDDKYPGITYGLVEFVDEDSSRYIGDMDD